MWSVDLVGGSSTPWIQIWDDAQKWVAGWMLKTIHPLEQNAIGVYPSKVGRDSDIVLSGIWNLHLIFSSQSTGSLLGW